MPGTLGHSAINGRPRLESSDPFDRETGSGDLNDLADVGVGSTRNCCGGRPLACWRADEPSLVTIAQRRCEALLRTGSGVLTSIATSQVWRQTGMSLSGDRVRDLTEAPIGAASLTFLDRHSAPAILRACYVRTAQLGRQSRSTLLCVVKVLLPVFRAGQ
jgi:hypothetical protein